MGGPRVFIFSDIDSVSDVNSKALGKVMTVTGDLVKMPLTNERP